jgi:hypothetical protein
VNVLVLAVATSIFIIWLVRQEKATARDGVEFVKRLAMARKI